MGYLIGPRNRMPALTICCWRRWHRRLPIPLIFWMGRDVMYGEPGLRNGRKSHHWRFSENGGRTTGRFLFNGSAYTQVKILENLTWEVKAGMRSTTSNYKSQTPVIPIYNFITGISEGFSNGTQTIDLTQTSTDSKYYTAYTTLNYTKTLFRDFNLDVLLGASKEKSVTSQLTGYRRGFASMSLDVLSAAPSADQSTGASETEYALQSFFGRLNLNYKSKYLLDVTMRRDGSSRFPPAYKYAVFPSFLAGWRISQESFALNNLPWMTELKLRASYGKLGNDAIGNSNYPYQSTLSTGANYPFADQGGVRLGNLANERLKWEETTTKDLGIDFNIHNSMIYGTFDYYIRTTSGILRAQQVPAYSGAGSPNVNLGVVDNKGFEIMLGHRQRVGQVSYGVEGNLTRQRNKLSKFGAPQYGGTSFLKEGYEMNRFFMYQGDGIYQSQAEIDNGPTTPWTQTPGDVRIKDVNGDGKVNADDRVDVNGVNPNFLLWTECLCELEWLLISPYCFQGRNRGRKVNGDRRVRYTDALCRRLLPPLVWWQDFMGHPKNQSATKTAHGLLLRSETVNSTRAIQHFLAQRCILFKAQKCINRFIPFLPYSQRKFAMQKSEVICERTESADFLQSFEFGDPENPFKWRSLHVPR